MSRCCDIMTLPLKILDNNEIASSNEEKRLGILLDSELNFDSHITSICKIADQNFSTVTKNKLILHPRSENFAIKISSKNQIQLLSFFLDLYFSIFNTLSSIHKRALRLI